MTKPTIALLDYACNIRADVGATFLLESIILMTQLLARAEVIERADVE